mmetsp:Transcript_128099/g.362632  ORF Transcript_128099/g.362632 Transcript_128099/m.362632 type:complete len:213 (-) Transcript_128099:502-1140(-)
MGYCDDVGGHALESQADDFPLSQQPTEELHEAQANGGIHGPVPEGRQPPLPDAPEDQRAHRVLREAAVRGDGPAERRLELPGEDGERGRAAGLQEGVRGLVAPHDRKGDHVARDGGPVDAPGLLRRHECGRQVRDQACSHGHHPAHEQAPHLSLVVRLEDDAGQQERGNRQMAGLRSAADRVQSGTAAGLHSPLHRFGAETKQDWPAEEARN